MKSKMGMDDRVPSFSLVDSSKESHPETSKQKTVRPVFDHIKFKQR